MLIPSVIIAIHTFFATIIGIIMGWNLFCTERLPKIKQKAEREGFYKGNERGWKLGRNHGFRLGWRRGFYHCYDTQVPIRLSNGRFSKPGLKPGSNTESPQREGGRVPLDMEVT